jgi:hypothetical protein
VEGRAEGRRHAADLTEARRVEPAAVPEHLPHLGVLPWRHVLEHVERLRDDLQAVVGTAEQADRCRKVVGDDEAGRLLDLVPGQLQPDLRGLVHRLEEQLVAVDPLVGRFLEREELLGAQVPLVVARRVAREDRVSKAGSFGHGRASVPSKIRIDRSASGSPPSAVTSHVSCM